MSKHKVELTQEVVARFEAILGRIKEVTGARTQVQLAEALEVRQSSISDAKRRASIPSDWLLKLERAHGVLAVWFESGEGPKFIAGSGGETIARVQQRLELITEDFVRLVDRCESSLETINMTEAQLQQRKAYAAGVLSVDTERARVLLAELNNMGADLSAVAQ